MDLADPEIEPGYPAFQADSLPTELSGKPPPPLSIVRGPLSIALDPLSIVLGSTQHSCGSIQCSWGSTDIVPGSGFHSSVASCLHGIDM